MDTMDTNKQENTADVLGLNNVTDRKSAEYDLVTSLLAAADFRNTADAVTPVEKIGRAHV